MRRSRMTYVTAGQRKVFDLVPFQVVTTPARLEMWFQKTDLQMHGLL